MATMYPCMKDITVKNGFTLAEVRDIRKRIRRIMGDSEESKRCNAEPFATNILDAFLWNRTKEGVLFWYKVDDQCIFRSKSSGESCFSYFL